MNQILILGGTGAMGKHLVSLLSQNSNNYIYITSRREHKSHGNIFYIAGNAHDENFIMPLLKEHHWTAIIDFMVYSTTDFSQKVNAFLDSTDQYVFLSSARVYAQYQYPIKENNKRLLDVSDDRIYLNTDEYALAKARQENILKKSGRSNWTIIRPYITFSENRLQLGVLEKEAWLYRALKGRTIVFSKDILEKRTTLTYGYDVARGIAALIGNPKSYNEIYHITVDETHTWKEILNVYINTIERYTGKKVKILLLDKHPYQDKNKPFYQLIYDRYFDRTFDNSKIGTIIDINTFASTLEGLRKCMEKFLDKQDFRNINWISEAGRDKLTKELPRIKEFHSIKTMMKYYFYRFLPF